MTSFLTADVHMTESPVDEYRFGLWKWINEQEFDELIVCGDLTNNKDHHSAKLVNRLHAEIACIARERRVIIVKGNHDYYSEEHPFFEFLGSIPNVEFMTKPTQFEISAKAQALFVPADTDWNNLVWDNNLDYIFSHVTWDGSKAENGSLLPGVNPGILKGFEGYVWSGDIHVPQKVSKNIQYIGAPYHTRFGDTFKPRCVILHDDGTYEDCRYPAPDKLVFDIKRVDELETMKAKKGDHVKVRVHMQRGEYSANWRNIRGDIVDICRSRNWLLFGTEPILLEGKKKSEEAEIKLASMSSIDIMTDYAHRHKAGAEHLRIGKSLLDIR